MYTGDEKPDLELTLSADDPVNTSTATAVRIIGRVNGTIIFDRAPSTTTIVGDTTVLTMLWQSADTDQIGRIQIEVEVTWPGDKQQTFRADGGVDVLRDFDYVDA
jgi:hypothetical protein